MKGAAFALALAALGACAKPAGVRALAAADPPQARSGGLWSYEVVAGGGEIDVVASFSAGTPAALTLDGAATPFVTNVEWTAAGTGTSAWQPAASQDGVWTVPACPRGCTVRYRFHLASAGASLNDIDTVLPFKGGFESPPSTWLLRPNDSPAGTTYRFHLRTTDGSRFATGVRAIAGSPDTYGAAADDLDSAPYTAFGDFSAHTVTLKDATIEVASIPGRLGLDDAALDRWITLSARAIESYYGRFPVPHALLLVSPMAFPHGETAEGRTLASGGSSILLAVSSSMTAADIPRDWVLTHEMTHLTLPDQQRSHHWIEEGLATYVEPIARAQVGTIEPEEVWRGLIDGLPNGEPEAGDEGLDRTHSWGRTYWGGALFALVADVEIHRRTANKKSLADALRGVLAAGGSGEVRWPIEEVFRRGDAAVGVPVLAELHAKWGTTPVTVDLPKLWAELGVRGDGPDGKKGRKQGIVFDDSAPLAAIRRAITARE